MIDKSNLDFAAYLNVKNAILPVFSADGTRLHYLSDITGTLQVWSVPVEGGWPDQLTFFEERVNLLEPSPVGESCIISRDQGGNEQDQLYMLKGGASQGVEISTLAEQPLVKHNFGSWRPDGGAISFSSNQRHPAFFDVYILEIKAGAEPKLVHQGDDNFYPLAWSHSGRYLLFQRANTNLDFDLFLLDLENLADGPRLLTPHTGSVQFSSPHFTTDDKSLYFITDLNRDFLAVAHLDLQNLEISLLATPDWDVETLELSPDNTQLAYTVNEAGYTRLVLIELSSAIEQLVSGLPQGVINKLAWSPQSERLAFDFSSPSHNSDVWVYDLSEKRSWQVTHSPRGGLNPTSFVEPEIVAYPGFDGLQIPALWFLPPGATPDSKLPVVLYVHGGPEGQTRPGWSPIFQYLLAEGFAVLAPNVRGSSGYGRHYLSLDDVRKRMDSVADLKYAAEWLHRQPQIDRAKIAVWGGSYGGFMVLSAVTTYPDLWAAGVDIVGIANMITLLENTSSYRRKLRAPEYGDLERDYDFLVEISPIHKAERITAPMIILHGEQDPRVPIDEARQIVASLLARHHPVEYLYFADEGHGITKLKNRLIAYPAIARFLDKYMMGRVEVY